MTLWVDADACPGPVKDVVVRAAVRRQVRTVFVANRDVALPASPWLSSVRVGAGLDVADRHIAQAASPGDLAITADIPLAALLVARQVTVLDPRGSLFTEENVGEALSLRNAMHELRESGVTTSGPRSFGPRDTQRFAAAFDQLLTRLLGGLKGK